MTTSRIEKSGENIIVENLKEKDEDILPQAGEYIGSFRIIDRIGSGGMSNVYKVWHSKLETLRAIKLLRGGFNDEAKQRLETEAKIAANLKHPNIVDIFGVGYWNGNPYVEMEYIEGVSLKELLERKVQLPLIFSLAVAHFVCVALDYAYNSDLTLYGKVYDRIIHRDIKPANILIDTRGIVKLTDFGIARPSEISIHTDGAKVMGTFAYLSPEQLNGEKLDQRSDVYSLGTVLYEMLSGTKTFPQKLLAELIQRKTKGQFIPLGSLGLNIPRELCKVVEKCISLDRNKRYEDAGEVDRELICILRKLTDLTPDEIICIYLKNPLSPELQIQKKDSNFYPSLMRGLKFSITLSVAALCFYLLLFVITPFVKKTLTILKDFSSLPFVIEQNSKLSGEFRDQIGTDNGKVENISTEQNISPPVIKKEDDRNAIISKPMESQSKLSLAIEKFNSGDYQKVIDILETISLDELTSNQRKLYIIRLLEAYLQMKYIDKASILCRREQVNDGLFYLLKSRLYLEKEQEEEAIEAAEKALNLPSGFDKNIAEKSAFHLATIYNSIFLRKPNSKNMELAKKGWEYYILSYCNNNSSKNCQYAKKQLALLEQEN
ncbi:MAG: serine/threonine protein kinase [Chitinispirillaceae bacterium]|nr:serine/threonine protein kinase [Chitinispirillaceae bacterium]